MERKVATESHQSMVVLVGSGKNFKSALEPDINNFRPLSITAWTQTINNDFMRLNEISKIEQTQREKELEEKVRILEEALKAQTDLLSQLFATSARTKILLGEQQPDEMQNNREEKPKTFNSSDKTPEMSPNTSNSDNNSPINSVINPLKQIDSSPSDSVKYTIVTETYGNNNDEPIEIQLAEDDGAINFNSSTNSEHLEICLTPEDKLDIKTETGINNSTRTRNISHSSTSSSEHHFTKKRKLTMAQSETLPSTSSNCIFNDQPNNSATDISPAKKPKCNDVPKNKRAGKNKNNNSNGSINVQTTSTLNTRRYPEPGIFEQSNPSATGSHDDENSLVPIGPHSTRVPSELYNRLASMSASIATRKLLTFIFDRKTLATHTMTGKPSPAFKDQGKPVKKMLNPFATADIIFAVTHKCKVSDKEVRNAITTKCADENKMYKAELSKRSPMEEINNENPVG